MAEVKDGKGVKLIAFYLPQFHAIPLNDQCWGKGFTEWTNVRKAQALFYGHDQPKIPLDLNYYDLMDDQVKIWQSNLAEKYGIFGFCYYHYWFKHGEKLLEKPAEQMLKNKKIEIPFCFCWANENWSKNWDGGDQEIIMEQDYGGKEEWERHFQYLLNFFQDERYITVDGCPLLVVYKPEQMIDIYKMASYFRRRAKEEGFPDLCLAFQFPAYYSDMYYRNDIFDYQIEFEPVYSRNIESQELPGTSRKISLIRKFCGEEMVSFYRKCRKKKGRMYWKKEQSLGMYFYDEIWDLILNAKWKKNCDGDLNRYKKNLPKRREAGTWLEPRRYEKEIYLLERLALETCFQKCFAVSGLFIEKQWRLFFTSFVVDKISIRENCDQNVYTG